jgi:hypothetical protein
MPLHDEPAPSDQQHYHQPPRPHHHNNRPSQKSPKHTSKTRRLGFRYVFLFFYFHFMVLNPHVAAPTSQHQPVNTNRPKKSPTTCLYASFGLLGMFFSKISIYLFTYPTQVRNTTPHVPTSPPPPHTAQVPPPNRHVILPQHQLLTTSCPKKKPK